MELIEETRRYYKFTSHGMPNNYDDDGIKVVDDVLFMPKIKAGKGKEFTGINDCLKWIGDMNMDIKMERKFANTHIKGISITDKQWEKMQQYMIPTAEFVKEDFRVYESWLAHNFVDRDKERFPVAIIKSFNKTIVGKSKLIGHNWGPPGEGRYFDSRIEKLSVDETIDFVGPVPNKKFREHLLEIEKRDGGIFFLVPTYYMLASETDMTRKIDSGIIRDESIGFIAGRAVEVKDEDGNVLWSEYQNNGDKEAEALEGSFVFLGSQYGAGTRKEAGSGDVNFPSTDEEVVEFRKKALAFIDGFILGTENDACKVVWTTAYIDTLEDNCFAIVENTGNKNDAGQTIPKTARHLPHHAKGNGGSGTEGVCDMPHLRNALARVGQTDPVTDTVTAEALRAKALKHLEAHMKRIQDEEKSANNNKETRMVTLKLFDASYQIDETPESLIKVTGEIEAKFAAQEAAAKVIRDENAALKALLAPMGEGATIENIKSIVKDAKDYKEFIIGEAIKYGCLVEMIDKEKVDERKAMFEKHSIAEIKERLDEYMKVYLKANRPDGILPETHKETTKPAANAASFQMN